MLLKKEKILITGHTGFVGSWLYYFFLKKKLNIYGISLKADNKKNLFNLLKLNTHKNSKILNILNYQILEKYINKIKPNIIIHLAAEALVLKSLKDPNKTYRTNIIGTLNILNVIKKFNFLKSAIFFTTDKVYKNHNLNKSFTEKDCLGGDDPYSSSKSASEMVINGFVKSFLKRKKIIVLRCGNIIGGGDISANRIVPDIIRSIKKGRELKVRNINSTRPWQHVLDVIHIIYFILIKVKKKKFLFKKYNIAPNSKSEKVKFIINEFKKNFFFKTKILKKNFKEKKLLRLNSSKIYNQLKIKNLYTCKKSIKLLLNFYINYLKKRHSIKKIINNEIQEYENNLKKK